MAYFIPYEGARQYMSPFIVKAKNKEFAAMTWKKYMYDIREKGLDDSDMANPDEIGHPDGTGFERISEDKAKSIIASDSEKSPEFDVWQFGSSQWSQI